MSRRMGMLRCMLPMSYDRDDRFRASRYQYSRDQADVAHSSTGRIGHDRLMPEGWVPWKPAPDAVKVDASAEVFRAGMIGALEIIRAMQLSLFGQNTCEACGQTGEVDGKDCVCRTRAFEALKASDQFVRGVVKILQ